MKAGRGVTASTVEDSPWRARTCSGGPITVESDVEECSAWVLRSKRLCDELQKVRAANPGSERVAELEQILASIHVVDPTDAPANSVTFGATVTVQDKKGATETFTIVGVDELDFEQDAVSWISSLAKRC
jgi:Transcription elongation factor, GreA/GreB, C-term